MKDEREDRLPTPGVGTRGRRLLVAAACLLPLLVFGCDLTSQHICENIVLPEQRTVEVRAPEQLPPTPVPPIPPPRTVTDKQPDTPEWRLSLDEAIHIALVNAKVIRVLAGVTANTSGRTIYDAAVTNTTIDQEQARFDPVITHKSTWDQTEPPIPTFDPFDFTRVLLDATRTQDYHADTQVTYTNVLGGQFSARWQETPAEFKDKIFGPNLFLLNPQTTSSVELSYTQPLLRNAGYTYNTAPIVLARIDTERSFFQLKDSVQELVRGVIEAYWTLVQARTDVWARKIQVEQSREQYNRERARYKTGFADIGNVAQSRVTYNGFRANLIAAEANVLAREGALRNLLFLPPSDHRKIVPVSAPTSNRFRPDWKGILETAEQRRPDIIELKLVLQADQLRLKQAQNQVLPQLDVQFLNRWNGLSGVMPNGEHISSKAGEFTDWTAGITFSVPVGLRQGRARVRQQELIIARDVANVEQGVHLAAHSLAITVRDLDSAYEQYEAYKVTRTAAEQNLKVQIEQFRTGRNIFLNVLTALNDWGNAVFSEAQALISYNVALATLERQTGTILETNGLVFFEERFRAAGPWIICKEDYPAANPVDGKPTKYPPTDEPSENAFDLRKPEVGQPGLLNQQQLPKPRELPPAAPEKP
jgi:outer membrane protein TolC